MDEITMCRLQEQNKNAVHRNNRFISLSLKEQRVR